MSDIIKSHLLFILSQVFGNNLRAIGTSSHLPFWELALLSRKIEIAVILSLWRKMTLHNLLTSNSGKNRDSPVGELKSTIYVILKIQTKSAIKKNVQSKRRVWSTNHITK